MTIRIEIKQVSKKFPSGKALDQLSLLIPRNEVLAILGPSGGGKSTLLRMIAGLEKPDTGQILLNHLPLTQDSASLIQHRRRVGIVFQGLNLFFHLTALENITLPLIYIQKYPRKKAQKQALDLLERFQLQNHAHKMPAELSGGQKQRVAIIRAIATQPDILLLDEPTSALDPIMTSEVLALIAELKNEKTPFILVTHHVHFAKHIADNIAFMSAGRLLELAPTEQFFNAPTTSEAKQYLEKVLYF